MIVFDTELEFLLDKDIETDEYSCVLRCFHDPNPVTFDRFNYADRGTYREATKHELTVYQCFYYLEDGSRPLKTLDCKKCKRQYRGGCNHDQKYYDK